MVRADHLTGTRLEVLKYPINGFVRFAVLIVLIVITWRAGDGILGVMDAARSSDLLFHATMLKHRYVAVAIALNTPGNIVIGDGGGIALVAGFSQLFSFRLFALTVMLAVSPGPIATMLWGV